jgi:Leucine-rich repeat (LRR) protein
MSKRFSCKGRALWFLFKMRLIPVNFHIVCFYAVKIASDAFDSLIHLQYLYLKKNFITHISEKHLRNLKNLIILDLAANKIQKIHPSAFRSLIKVSELHLSQNSLNQIPENLFIAMRGLKRLMLFSNDFRYLHSKSFIGLRFVKDKGSTIFMYINIYCKR